MKNLSFSWLSGLAFWGLFFQVLSLPQTFAQYSVRDYGFTQNIGNYNEIIGGTILGTSSNQDEIFNGTVTGATGVVVGTGFPIGFPFVYEGIQFDRFAVSTNGYIRLGTGNFTMNSVRTTDAFSWNPTATTQSDTNHLLNLIGALQGNLQAYAGSELSFKTEGTAPNRELIVQWKQYQFSLAGSTDDFNFQIRLKENGNKIVCAYGNFIKNSTNRVFSVGLRGSAYKIVQMRMAREDSSQTWETSGLSYSRGTRCDLRSSFVPPTGLQFTYTPIPPALQDMGVVALTLSPSIVFGCPGLANDSLKVSVRNFGSQQQSAFPYGFRLNNGSTITGTLPLNPPLVQGEARMVTLPNTVDLSAPGPYAFKIWSSLPNDTGLYHFNDTLNTIRNLYGPAPSPFSAIGSLVDLTAAGWKQYRGTSRPNTENGRFLQSTLFKARPVYINVLNSTTDTIHDWFVSPSIQRKPGLFLKFRAAITRFDTNTTVTTIGDDVIRVMLSTDCGASWTPFYQFTNDSLTAGKINNIKRSYVVPVPQGSGPFQIAFYVYNNATTNPLTYYFHFDDVAISQGNAWDLAASRIRIESLENPGCSLTQFPVKMWIRNLGDSTVASSSARIKVNNGPFQIQNFNFTPALATGDSTEITFPAVTVVPNSYNWISATTFLSTEDGYSSTNDTAGVGFPYLGSANPLAVPYSIDFEGLPSGVPSGWLVDQAQGTDFKVRIRGVGSSRSLSANMYQSNRSSFAVTPYSGVVPPNHILRFAVRFKNDLTGFPFSLGANDSLVISVSTDCGNTFSTLRIIKATNAVGIENYATVNLDLSAYAGLPLAVRFQVWMFRNDFAGAWCDLDNISITPNTGIAPQLEDSELDFYPNPGTGIFHLRHPGQLVRFRVWTQEGKTVRNGYSTPSGELNFSDLKKGLYFLELEEGNRVVRKKIVLE